MYIAVGADNLELRFWLRIPDCPVSKRPVANSHSKPTTWEWESPEWHKGFISSGRLDCAPRAGWLVRAFWLGAFPLGGLLSFSRGDPGSLGGIVPKTKPELWEDD